MSANHRPLLPAQPNLALDRDSSGGCDSPFTVVLDAATVEAIVEATARRTVKLLRSEASAPPVRLVDAAAVAAILGCSRQWVYANAEALGGRRLGDGPKPRLRFDPETAQSAGACLTGKQSQAPDASAHAGSRGSGARRPRRSPNGAPKVGSILVARGRASSKAGGAHGG